MAMIHVVKSGDTIDRLARQYGVTTNAIVRANGLEQPNHLVIGLSLVIPAPYLRYTVRAGDTLDAIARTYRTTVQELMQLNTLTNPRAIYPGLRLIVPIIAYTVRQGDTITSVARRFGITPQAIQQANGLASSNAQLHAGQTLRIPEPPKRTIDVNAFTTVFGQAGAREVRDVAHSLTYVAPFGYRMKADGSLEAIDDVPTIQAARNGQIVPIMAITNFSATEAGTKLAHTILSNPSLSEKILDNTLAVMRQKGYRGLNIDFENVSPEDRENYNSFLQKAVNKLHPAGFFVSSSLAPKTSAGQKGLLYEAHDYPAHGRILDFVVPMTYEWGYRFGPPQPISPVNLMRQVIQYAVSVIPSNKILLGFQVYARDWVLPHVKGQEAETFDMQEAIRRAVEHNAVIQYNETAQSPFFRYTDARGRQHEVWFEDARSAQAKFNLVKEFNLKGVSYWVLGYPFPQNWTLLADNFIIRKI
jgi:spore germination protein